MHASRLLNEVVTPEVASLLPASGEKVPAGG